MDGTFNLNMRRCACCGFEMDICDIDDYSFIGCPDCNYPIWVCRHESFLSYYEKSYYTIHDLDQWNSNTTKFINVIRKCYTKRQVEKLLEFLNLNPKNVKIIFHPKSSI